MSRLRRLSSLHLQVGILGREKDRLYSAWERRGGTKEQQDELWKRHEDAHREWREKSAELKRAKARKP